MSDEQFLDSSHPYHEQPDQEQIDQLISHYLNETLSADGHQQLANWITASAENAKFFSTEVYVQSAIQDQFTAEVKANSFHIAMHSDTDAFDDQGKRFLLKLEALCVSKWSSIAAAFALLLIIGFWQIAGWGSNEHQIARITGGIDLVWAEVDGEETTGIWLGKRQYHLEQGIARIAFPNGAIAVLDASLNSAGTIRPTASLVSPQSADINNMTQLSSGAVIFDLIDEQTIQLHAGRVVVICPDERSQGFAVRTPMGDIIDLGTEFAVSVNQKEGQILAGVLEGEVAIRTSQNSADSQQVLKAGEAILSSVDDETWTNFAFDPSIRKQFIRPSVFHLKHHLANLRNTAPGHFRQSLIDDQSLLFWSDMHPVTRGSGIANYAQLSHALIGSSSQNDSLKTRTGRAGGENAIEFLSRGDHLSVDLSRADQSPESIDQLTFAAWIKLDPEDVSADPMRHRGLVMTSGWGRPGQVHWQIKDSDFRISIFDQGDEVDERYPAPARALQDGEWHHIASVIDQQRGVVTHYLDGELLVVQPMALNPLESRPALRLDNLTIGGWLPPVERLEEDRNLNGAIDELMIWNRALTTEEIERLYFMTAGG